MIDRRDQSPTPGTELLQMELAVQGEDWKPTPHGHFLAEVLARHEFASDKEVLELGAGVANHTILLLRQEPRRVVATEISEELLATTQSNVERNLPDVDNLELRVADWLDTTGEFDLIVTNPPFCKSGKQNRRYFIDSLILDAHKRLREGGELVFVQSSMADLDKTLKRLEENGYAPRVVDETTGEFRDYYFEDETFMEEIREVPNGFEVRDGTYYETLYVVHAVLETFSPPPGAHIVT